MINLELLLWSLNVCITYFYGSVFTLLFLDVNLKEKKNKLIFTVFSLLCIGLQLTIGYISSMNTVTHFYPLLVHLPLLFVCLLGYKKNLIASLASILLCYYLTSPRYVVAALLLEFIPNMPVGEATARIIASLLLSIVIYRWVVPLVRQSFRREQRDIMYFFIPLMIVYVLSYLLYVYTDLLYTKPMLMIEIIFTLFFYIIMSYIHLYFITFDRTLKLENRNNILDLYAESMHRQLATLKASSEESKVLRHDIRHFALLMKQYAKEGDLEKLLELGSAIEQKNDALIIDEYCQNNSVNLILSTYISQLKQENIPYDLELHIPNKVFVNEMDLCTILSNALENATTCLLQCKASPHLSLEINCDDNRLFLKLDNTCLQPVSFKDGLPLSSRVGHGYGSKSIAYLADKYHGICSFSLKNRIFTTQVILHASDT